jgi:hypothetical protein
MGKPATPTGFGTTQDHFSAFIAAGQMLMDDESPDIAGVNNLLAHLVSVVDGVQFDQALINSPGGDELDKLLVWAENTSSADDRTAELVELLRQTAI